VTVNGLDPEPLPNLLILFDQDLLYTDLSMWPITDGKEIDYRAWPLVEAPWVEAALGSGRVVFRRDGESLEMDFQVDPAKPMLPMRVIG